LSDHAAASNS